MATQLTVEQRIERSNLAIMKHEKFCCWAGLLFIGKTKVSDKCPTAYVNGKGDVTFGRAFVESLESVGGSDVYLNYLNLHERGHTALMHLTRGKFMFKENRNLANIAADHVVNNMLLEVDPDGRFAKMPNINGKDVGVCDVKYKGWSLREVYMDLKKNPPKQGEQPMDEHEEFEEGEKEGSEPDGTEQAIEVLVEQALRSGSYLAGKQGGGHDRLMAGVHDPQIPWQDLLAEFVQESMEGESDATWKRHVKRFISDEIYYPTMEVEAVGAMGCYIDTSGSVGQQEMTACLTEVVTMAKLCNPAKLYVVYWSDGIEREEVYLPEQYDSILTLTKPTGGGGTTVEECAVHAQKADIACAIILTDGYIYGPWGDWGDVPTLWCITTSKLAPFGKTVKLAI